MNDIREFARKLQVAADALTALFDKPRMNENAITARAIVRELKTKRKKYKKRAKRKPHWTQTPAGKRKMAQRMRKVWADKKAAAKS